MLHTEFFVTYIVRLRRFCVLFFFQPSRESPPMPRYLHTATNTFCSCFCVSEEQKRAREQIQAACQGRQPRLEDRARLTTVDAIVLETLRFTDISELWLMNGPHQIWTPSFCSEDSIFHIKFERLLFAVKTQSSFQNPVWIISVVSLQKERTSGVRGVWMSNAKKTVICARKKDL